MGDIIVEGDETVYRQENGEITAWMNDFEEKMELAHESSSKFKRIFYLLVAMGILYLCFVFVFY